MGGTWGPSCFAHDDRVFVVDLQASPNEFGPDGWRARSGVVQKIELAEARVARGSRAQRDDEVVHDKLVLTLFSL